MKKALFICIGMFSLVLGLLGVMLPVLPTTPFVLLAAACFCKGSDRLYRWLLSTRYFGSLIENYRKHNGVPLRVKRVAIAYLWVGLIISSILAHNIYVWVILAVVGIGVTVHLATMKTRVETDELIVSLSQSAADEE